MNKIINPKIFTKKILDYLDSQYNLKPKSISNKTGLDYEKIRSIKNRGSGGTIEMVKTLIKHYPELVEKFELEVEEKTGLNIETRLKQLENDNRILKEIMVKMLKDRGGKR